MTRQLRIIWASLAFCVLLYGAIIMMLSPNWPPPQSDMQPLMSNPILIALGFAALGSLVLAFVILPRLPLQASNPDNAQRQRSIVRWALIESVAIYGLVGSFLMQDIRVFALFGLVSIVGFVATFPRDYTPQRAT
jgi:F0F1-type ATP synthase membrane subunit c/vacuolar-type H+-ATPase subunit K